MADEIDKKNSPVERVPSPTNAASSWLKVWGEKVGDVCNKIKFPLLQVIFGFSIIEQVAILTNEQAVPWWSRAILLGGIAVNATLFAGSALLHKKGPEPDQHE